MYILELNPELWNIACPHRTEILYQADISMILFLLELRPGLTVLESGTGSGVLSTYIASSIYPNGKLYTFEYHSERKIKSEEDFKNNGLDDIITIEQRDVVKDGFPEHLINIDRAFLDLPSPWVVIPKMVRNLKHDSIVSSFSPCIEQVHKTCEAMRENNFVNIITIECLQRPYTIQRINLDTDDDLEIEKELFVNSLQGNITKDQGKKRKRDEINEDNDDDIKEKNEESMKRESEIRTSSNRVAMSKPVGTMRGHTGYLTFARLFKKDE